MNRTLSTCILILALATASASAEPFASLAPFLDDVEAAKAGAKIGIGKAELVGPDTVEVLTHNSWTLRYTAGKAGIAPGGGLRIAMRHIVQWSPPQTKDPRAEAYLTATASNGAPVLIYIEYNASKRFFRRYHPWQNIVEIILPDKGLAEGETLSIVYGDPAQGSKGMRVQPFDEEDFTFKVYVDPRADDTFYPLIDNPTIDIIAAEPCRLGIVMPSDAVRNEPAWCIVRAEDRYGNPADRYRGTVKFDTDSPVADLPYSYTFTAADRGVKRFDNVRFGKTGTCILIIEDGDMNRESNPVRVHAEQPERLLLWGDLHGHTLHSDGRGTVEQFYDFAENVAGLDFCAVTDHAFEITEAMWEHSKQVTSERNRDGRFVTFQAYEWSGVTDVGGDHNIFFLDDNPPIYRSRSYYDYRNLQMYHGPEPQVNHIEDLFAVLAPQLKDKDIFAIPHYGGRKGNPDWHNPRVQRMIEVFSEHRRSEDWVTPFLKNRYRLGIIASTDGHFGNPGYGYLKPTYDWNTQEIGMASVAVYAQGHNRRDIFTALYDRHVYATSGDRILLDVRADGHLMGSEIRADKAPVFAIRATGTDAITRVEIKKDSELVHTIEPNTTTTEFIWTDPHFNPSQECYYYVRVVQTNNEEAISSPIWVN